MLVRGEQSQANIRQVTDLVFLLHSLHVCSHSDSISGSYEQCVRLDSWR